MARRADQRQWHNKGRDPGDERPFVMLRATIRHYRQLIGRNVGLRNDLETRSIANHLVIEPRETPAVLLHQLRLEAPRTAPGNRQLERPVVRQPLSARPVIPLPTAATNHVQSSRNVSAT